MGVGLCGRMGPSSRFAQAGLLIVRFGSTRRNLVNVVPILELVGSLVLIADHSCQSLSDDTFDPGFDLGPGLWVHLGREDVGIHCHRGGPLCIPRWYGIRGTWADRSW